MSSYSYMSAMRSEHIHEANITSVKVSALGGKELAAFMPEGFNVHDAGKRQLSEAISDVREYRMSDGTVYKYHEIADNGVCITACVPASASLVVPSEIDGREVRELGRSAFAHLRMLRKVSCPATVKAMGARAFEGCDNMEELVLPAGVNEFDALWLHGCRSLRDLTLPGELEKVPANVFDSCKPKTLRLGAMVREVVPGSFTKSSLERVVVDPANPFLRTDDHALIEFETNTLVALLTPMEQYDVPDAIRVIGPKAFSGVAGLRRVSLPDGLEEVGDFAFMNSELEEFESPSNLRIIGSKAFYRCLNLNRVELNEGLRLIGEETFARSSLAALAIPGTVESIGQGAFAFSGIRPRAAVAATDEGQSGLSLMPSCHNLVLDDMGGLYRRTDEGLVLIELLFDDQREYFVSPGTVRIEPRAFQRNGHIEEVWVPDGVTFIGSCAFRGCSRLQHVHLPETIEVIEDRVFFETNLKSLYFGKRVREVGELALITGGSRQNDCPHSLTDFRVHPDNPVFYVHTGLLCERKGDGASQVIRYVGPDRNVVVPDEVHTICPYALAGVETVDTLWLHAHIEQLGLCGLALGASAKNIHLELAEPVDGRTSIDMSFPPGDGGVRACLNAFGDGEISAHDMFYNSDNAVYWSSDLYLRVTRALDRLCDPIFLEDVNKTRLLKVFDGDLTGICVMLSRHGNTRAFEQMVDLGILDERGLTLAVDKVNDAGDVAMTGFLLELKHRRFAPNRGQGSDIDLSAEFDL